MEKLIRVHKATMKGPQRGSQHPTNARPRLTIDTRRLRATSTIFSRERAARKGEKD